jgi:hypothetical protein
MKRHGISRHGQNRSYREINYSDPYVSMSEPARFFIEIARPGGYGAALWGVTEEGWYTVEGTSLRLTDAADMPRLNYEGKPRSATLGPKDNPRQVAAQLLRASLGSKRTNGFSGQHPLSPVRVAFAVSFHKVELPSLK